MCSCARVRMFLGKLSASNISACLCSIVYQHEFSARLSVTSVLRLRASALVALSSDSNTDSTAIYRLARLFLGENTQLRGDNRFSASDLSEVVMKAEDNRDIQHSIGNNDGIIFVLLIKILYIHLATSLLVAVNKLFL